MCRHGKAPEQRSSASWLQSRILPETPKVHDCQCCHERDDKKRTTEANAETDHNASHADVHGIAAKAVRTSLDDGSGRRNRSHRRSGLLEEADARTDEND